MIVDFLMRQETARLAHLDERLQLLAALGDFFFGECRFIEAELAHQRALLGARDLHAQRLGLRGLGFAFDLGLAFEVGLEVRQVDVAVFRLLGLVGLFVDLRLATALALRVFDDLQRGLRSGLGERFLLVVGIALGGLGGQGFVGRLGCRDGSALLRGHAIPKGDDGLHGPTLRHYVTTLGWACGIAG